MSAFRRIVEFVVVADEVAFERRLIVVAGEPGAVALQAVDVESARLAEPRGKRRIGGMPQHFAGRPHEAAA
jgi:hypothetical protein